MAKINITILKGLSNIVQIRERSAEVVTTIKDNLKIWLKTDHYQWYKLEKNDLNNSLILPTILLQFNYILVDSKSSQSNKLAVYTISDI